MEEHLNVVFADSESRKRDMQKQIVSKVEETPVHKFIVGNMPFTDEKIVKPLLSVCLLSRNCLFEGINSLQCHELTSRCNHLILHVDFTIDLCCIPLMLHCE